MTDKHRATPEQWDAIKWRSTQDGFEGCSVLLELRARVEALEADQHRHSLDCRGLNDDQIRGISALIAAATGSAEPPVAPPPKPTSDSSLVKQVRQRLVQGAGNTWEETARAAIRAVAEWLRQNDAQCQMGGDAAATADLLDVEASR